MKSLFVSYFEWFLILTFHKKKITRDFSQLFFLFYFGNFVTVGFYFSFRWKFLFLFFLFAATLFLPPEFSFFVPSNLSLFLHEENLAENFSQKKKNQKSRVNSETLKIKLFPLNGGFKCHKTNFPLFRFISHGNFLFFSSLNKAQILWFKSGVFDFVFLLIHQQKVHSRGQR